MCLLAVDTTRSSSDDRKGQVEETVVWAVVSVCPFPDSSPFPLSASEVASAY